MCSIVFGKFIFYLEYGKNKFEDIIREIFNLVIFQGFVFGLYLEGDLFFKI